MFLPQRTAAAIASAACRVLTELRLATDQRATEIMKRFQPPTPSINRSRDSTCTSWSCFYTAAAHNHIQEGGRLATRCTSDHVLVWGCV